MPRNNPESDVRERTAHTEDDQRQSERSADDRKQTTGVATVTDDRRTTDTAQTSDNNRQSEARQNRDRDDREPVSDRRQSRDNSSASDGSAATDKPDYVAMVYTRLTEDHPATAERFRNGETLYQDTDKRLLGMAASRMETDARHISEAVTEASKFSSDQVRWQMAEAATDRMLTRQSKEADNKEAKAAYSGQDAADNQYREAFFKMTLRDQNTIETYKRQITACLDRAADPSDAKFNSRQAGKEIRRIMRDANKFLQDKGVIDSKGNLTGQYASQNGSNASDTAAANATAGVRNTNETSGERFTVQTRNSERDTAAASDANSNGHRRSEDDRKTVSQPANDRATNDRAANDQAAASGTRTEQAAVTDRFNDVDRITDFIRRGTQSAETEHKAVQVMVDSICNKPRGESDGDPRSHVADATVAAYREQFIASIKDDQRQEYNAVRGAMSSAADATCLIQPERFSQQISDANIEQYGSQGAELKALRNMAGDPDASVVGRLQHALLDNVAERVDNATGEHDLVATQVKAVIGLADTRRSAETFHSFETAIAGNGTAALNDIKQASALNVAMGIKHGFDEADSAAGQAAAAGLAHVSFQAAKAGDSDFLAAAHNQKQAEGSFIQEHQLRQAMSDWQSVNYDPSEAGLQQAKEAIAAIDESWAKEQPNPARWQNGKATADDDVTLMKDGYFTVRGLAQETTVEINRMLQAERYEMPRSLKERIAMLNAAQGKPANSE